MSITADPETQTRVREALLSLGLAVPCGAEIALTDTGAAGLVGHRYLVSPSQLAAAVDQHQLVTGELLDLESALPWHD
ncbi:hypothetical protein [Gordonia sp. 852002-50395_SCH5434458]|uniref:hypothetical protein n=1 Tax=Gordonia sp. 852002-50395_SCH5434458 TaxID=1834090 RepID=UPI0007E9F10C|nr:hypothetical protein [Gordonia sp. 852002-50395_SCH5434458]OBC02718.1 hypothetical protein A5785_02585 [Gordonia sp. 852002-50395_SCH5434458]